MLVGYVSDERYVALADVLLEFIDEQGNSLEARSRATGSVHADLPAGDYRVVLQKPGFGAKFSVVTIPLLAPHQFRLLADGLLGYAWPKWVRSGQEAEFRVHSVEQYQLELWRYGMEPDLVRQLGWHDEHGPWATMQVTPDGDYTRTGAQWNKVGYVSPTHRQFDDGGEWQHHFIVELRHGRTGQSLCRSARIRSQSAGRGVHSVGGDDGRALSRRGWFALGV